MLKIEYAKVAYLFEGVNNGVLPDETAKIIRSLQETENLYLSAIREIATKLENLNDEFKYCKDHARSFTGNDIVLTVKTHLK